MVQKQSHISSVLSVNTCSQCGREFDPATEQAYELEGDIVCPTCVAAMDAPAQSPADDLAAFAAARSPDRPRRGGASRPKVAPKRKSSNAGMVLALLGLLAVTGVSGWLYSNGMLERWLRDTKGEVTGVNADNEQVGKYNALVNAANEQAKARDYAKAAATLKDAKRILEGNPNLPQVGPNALTDITSKIAQYESMSQRKAPANAEVSATLDE